jgi:hypothetical protein
LTRLDFLKIDTEGWDFDVLRSHDFERLPPRLAMVEFGTEFERQNMGAIAAAIDGMASRGYGALVFSYDDDGNFRRQVWRYRLIALRLGAAQARADGQSAGNILFFRRGDALFLATVLRLLRSFLPPRERLAISG